jgi:putative Ca2+/H+ antiporter (TMEM165/GDT1 family)
LFLALGYACAFTHAFIDFIFNSPAYWMALIAFLAMSAKLLSLEKQRN